MDLPKTHVVWKRAVRIIRSLHPPIDLFEDIADPADWPLLMSGEQKTNPRLMETLGNLDLVPRRRRVGGAGASYLMAPFTHVSPDRPTRFSAGAFGVLYVAESFETALFETMHHHALFMVATGQKPGWTSQFREILLDVNATLHDLRGLAGDDPVLAPDDYDDGQALGASLRAAGSDGVVLSERTPSGRGVCWRVLSGLRRVGDAGPAPGLPFRWGAGGFLPGRGRQPGFSRSVALREARGGRSPPYWVSRLQRVSGPSVLQRKG